MAHVEDLTLLAETEDYWSSRLTVTERVTTHTPADCRPCTQALTDAIVMATATGSLGCNASRNEVGGTLHEARWHRAPVEVR